MTTEEVPYREERPKRFVGFSDFLLANPYARDKLERMRERTRAEAKRALGGSSEAVPGVCRACFDKGFDLPKGCPACGRKFEKPPASPAKEPEPVQKDDEVPF